MEAGLYFSVDFCVDFRGFFEKGCKSEKNLSKIRTEIRAKIRTKIRPCLGNFPWRVRVPKSKIYAVLARSGVVF